MSLINHIDIPKELWKGIYQTGSSVICNPPVLDTDIDYIICDSKGRFDTQNLHKFLISNGFEMSCQDEEEYDLESEAFDCYRKDNINLIVTDNYEWYLKWVAATQIATRLNLIKKEDRIVLFKYILYGEM